MRISDWSSDVCSSDLRELVVAGPDQPGRDRNQGAGGHFGFLVAHADGHVERHVHAEGVAPLHERAPGLLRRAAVGAEVRRWQVGGLVAAACRDRRLRSEEHTSELQSLMRISYAVFCLKKKK